MKTLFQILNPSIHNQLAMLNAHERDEIIKILDSHVLFTQMKIIEMLYIANHLGLPTDVKLMYSHLFNPVNK